MKSLFRYVSVPFIILPLMLLFSCDLTLQQPGHPAKEKIAQSSTATNGMNVCATCHGLGRISCNQCLGNGRFTCTSCTGGKVSCSFCSGNGKSLGSDSPCGICGGSGQANCSFCNGTSSRSCSFCNGQGQVNCPDCNGAGVRS